MSKREPKALDALSVTTWATAMIQRVITILIKDSLRAQMNLVAAPTRRGLVDSIERLHQLSQDLLGEDVPHERLIEAENFLCKFVGDRLLPGFDIYLRMSGLDCELSLTDPDGNNIEIAGEARLSSIALAIEEALRFDPEANDGSQVTPAHEHASRPMATDGAQRPKCGCVHDGDYEE